MFVRHFKKFVSIFLALVMVMGLSVTAFAQTTDVPASEYTVDDVKALEPYISVVDGLFVFDTESAIADNVDTELINGQSAYLAALNSKATNGIITINDDLSIEKPSTMVQSRAGHWENCGGGLNTNTTEYWWGYARYACDCETNRMSADFNSCASVAAGIGVAGIYFGPIVSVPGGLASGYWWLLASRLDANNHGKGVYVEMTWALVFDITPQ